jgi:hypothetical protein
MTEFQSSEASDSRSDKPLRGSAGLTGWWSSPYCLGWGGVSQAFDLAGIVHTMYAPSSRFLSRVGFAVAPDEDTETCTGICVLRVC